MDTVILILTGLFLIWIICCLIGYTFEMNQVDEVIEETSKEYWNEYWEKEGQDDEGKSVSEAD